MKRKIAVKKNNDSESVMGMARGKKSDMKSSSVPKTKIPKGAKKKYV